MVQYIPIPQLTERQLRRFWSSIDQSGGPDACWIWTGHHRGRGYGRIYLTHHTFVAHRVAYFLANDKDPGEFFVCHSCDNPTCVNPAHLWLGTCLDNRRDAVMKGRTARGENHGAYTKPERRRHGENHGRAKLTEDDVREIRRLNAETRMTKRAIGKEFGVSECMIGFIVRRENWKHVA